MPNRSALVGLLLVGCACNPDRPERGCIQVDGRGHYRDVADAIALAEPGATLELCQVAIVESVTVDKSVTIVGLGPAGPELLTAGTLARLDATIPRFLRTERHPAAPAVVGAESFDALYDAHTSFDAVYAAIVDALVAAASEHGEVLYAVPGSPVVARCCSEPCGSTPAIRGSAMPASRGGQTPHE